MFIIPSGRSIRLGREQAMRHPSLALWLEAGDNHLLISDPITKEKNGHWLWFNLATLDESSTVAAHRGMKMSVKGYLYEWKATPAGRLGRYPINIYCLAYKDDLYYFYFLHLKMPSRCQILYLLSILSLTCIMYKDRYNLHLCKV